MSRLRPLIVPLVAEVRVVSIADIMKTMITLPPSPEQSQQTLSSWLKNMNKLDSLINRLQELASSAPPENRAQLLNKVAALRATFKKQQERFIEFLKLSEEYADNYLHNISTQIEQQSTVLDNLRQRLDAANKIQEEAVDLQTFNESGTVAAMKDLRAPTGKTVPCCLKRQNTEIFDFQDFQGHFLRMMRYSARWTPWWLRFDGFMRN